MLKIQRSSNGEVIFRLAGRLNEEHVAEMETLLMSEAATREIVLDLQDLTLVDRDAVRFLERCEAVASSSRIVQLTSASGSGENEARDSGQTKRSNHGDTNKLGK
jgi:anti-anti-sigma regulatory factor